MANVEVKVNLKEIKTAVDNLRKIAEGLNNRSLNVSFSISKGAAVDELCQMAEQLHTFGTLLALVVDETANRLENGGEAFKAMDSQGQAMFKEIGTVVMKMVEGR